MVECITLVEIRSSFLFEKKNETESLELQKELNATRYSPIATFVLSGLNW
jgi:hypothetical protein